MSRPPDPFTYSLQLMKRSLSLLALSTALAVGLGSAGCSNKPKNLTPIPGRTIVEPGPATSNPPITNVQPAPTPPPPGPTPVTNIRPGGTGQGNVPEATTLTDPNATGTGGLPTADLERFGDMIVNRDAFRANTVHFDFDKAIVKAEDRPHVEAVASQLKLNSDHAVLIEGHCDERGTEGYNLALGERRALAVREYLANLGIDPTRVRTISYGEARPAIEGQTESAYAANRRAEFILLLPKL